MHRSLMIWVLAVVAARGAPAAADCQLITKPLPIPDVAKGFGEHWNVYVQLGYPY